MPLKIAITGATGFVGSNLVNRLSEDGHCIRALTRVPRKTRHPITWITGNLQNVNALTELCAEVDAVIHCAAVVRGNSLDYFRTTNVYGTELLLETLKRTSFSGKFLLLSSLAARCPEYSWYAQSKREAETLLLNNPLPFTTTIFRPTAVYGPGDREMQPVLQWMKRGWLVAPAGKQNQISLLHVDDLVAATVHWLQTDDSYGIFELDDGTSDGFTWDKLITIGESVWKRKIRKISVPINILRLFSHINLALARIFRYQAMLSPGKINEIAHQSWVCDNTRLSRKINWTPQQKLTERIDEAACQQPVKL